MKVFVTGATGFVGSAVVHELIMHGHKVTGLARSAASAAQLTAAGAAVHFGSLEDLESLMSGAAKADGVIHCAFSNDFSKFAQSGIVEKDAIGALGQCLQNSSRPLVVTSGVALVTPGRATTEQDSFPYDSPIPRNPEQTALAFVEQGVRAVVVRLSPSTHGDGEGGFTGLLVNIARDKQSSAYIEDGNNRWAAVHRKDAAVLFRLALEKGIAGERYHAVAQQGVATKHIAAAIGKALNLPIKRIAAADAESHFGWFYQFAQLDTIADSERTRRTLSWTPKQLELIDDIQTNLK
jgi:nucleoside-diphosphate-sugar epimerase